MDFTACRDIVVLTGAGISVASGLRTYRGEGGLWREHDAERLSTIGAFEREPDQVWAHYGSLRRAVRDAAPNAAHRALARWEADLPDDRRFLLVTQNVDSLHLAAGSRRVVEYHGNLMRSRCARDDCDLEPFDDEVSYEDALPQCPICGSLLRPDIVMFGEMIPALADWEAKRALRDCDLFLAIGTSGTVMPAAGFVRAAAYAGARTVLVNLEPQEGADGEFDEVHYGPVEELVPQLLGLAGSDLD